MLGLTHTDGYDPYGGGGSSVYQYQRYADVDVSSFFSNSGLTYVTSVNLGIKESQHGEGGSSSYGGSSGSNYNAMTITIPSNLFCNATNLKTVGNIHIGVNDINSWLRNMDYMYENNEYRYTYGYNNAQAEVVLPFSNYFANCTNLTDIGSITMNISEFTNLPNAKNTSYGSNMTPVIWALPWNNQMTYNGIIINNMLKNCPNLTVNAINNVLTFFNNIGTAFYGSDFGFNLLGLTQDQYNNISSLPVVSSLISKGWSNVY